MTEVEKIFFDILRWGKFCDEGGDVLIATTCWYGGDYDELC